MSIKSLRETAGLTQEQLAEEIKVDVNWLKKLERNEIPLEEITLFDAAKLLRKLSHYEDDKIVSETYFLAGSVYCAMKALLKEAAEEVAAEETADSVSEGE